MFFVHFPHLGLPPKDIGLMIQNKQGWKLCNRIGDANRLVVLTL